MWILTSRFFFMSFFQTSTHDLRKIHCHRTYTVGLPQGTPTLYHSTGPGKVKISDR